MIDIQRLVLPLDSLISELQKTAHPSAQYFSDAKVQILVSDDEAYKFNCLDALKGVAPMSSYGSFNEIQDTRLSELLDVVHELLESFQKAQS